MKFGRAAAIKWIVFGMIPRKFAGFLWGHDARFREIVQGIPDRTPHGSSLVRFGGRKQIC